MNRYFIFLFVCFFLACGGRSGLEVWGYADSAAPTTSSSGDGGTGGQVLPTGQLTVELSTRTPPITILAAGQDDWIVFTQYTLTNQSEWPIQIQKAVVAQRRSQGDVADFLALALATDDMVIRLAATEPLTADADQQWTLSQEIVPLIIPPESQLTVQLVAKLAPVMPGSIDTEPWHGVARSGHTPALELAGLKTAPDSGEFTVSIAPHTVPFMVIRKSRPVVQAEPHSQTLVEGDQTLFSFRLHAEGAGGSLAQFAIRYTKTTGLFIPHLGLAKNSVALPVEFYQLHDEKGGGTIPADLTEDRIWVVFTNEMAVGNNEEVYALTGQVEKPQPGQSINFFFDRTVDQTEPITGYLTTTMSLIEMAQKGIIPNTPTPYDPLPGYPAYFLWSDLSAADSHGLFSGDWTTDLYVQDLIGQQTLSL